MGWGKRTSTLLNKPIESLNFYALEIKTYKLKNYIQKNTAQYYSKVAARLQREKELVPEHKSTTSLRTLLTFFL